MENTLAAIGFSKLESDEALDNMIEEILENPTVQIATRLDDKRILAEYTKEFGNNIYISVRMTLDKKTQESLQVLQCEPYIEASTSLNVQNVEVENINYHEDYYVICEHRETGMQVIFWLQNAVEYLEAKRKDIVCKQINITGLACEGTIVLPVEKNEEDDVLEREERSKLREILQLIKEGDQNALKKLEEEEKALDKQLKQRLKEEDFLTIMSGYFIPVTLEDAVYAVLGEITGIDKRINQKTKEEFYLLSISVNDMPLEVAINCNTLIGMPTIGMRFMGTCWVQGKMIIE
ncbi:MAG: DUF3881 family protein [Cellulosilyticaceae bacterium]